MALSHWWTRWRAKKALKRKDPYKGLSVHDRFTKIYKENHWESEESISGPGSASDQTTEVKNIISKVIREYGISSMLDLPCGDFGWMKDTDLQGCLYIGGDIVEELVTSNRRSYGSDRVEFRILDLISDPLPETDLILVRDCLVHLSEKQIGEALENIRKSGIKYLLTTTFTSDRANYDIHAGDWRPVNLLKPPFLFPQPLAVFNENCTENGGKYSDKSLALWSTDQIPVP